MLQTIHRGCRRCVMETFKEQPKKNINISHNFICFENTASIIMYLEIHDSYYAI